MGSYTSFFPLTIDIGIFGKNESLTFMNMYFSTPSKLMEGINGLINNQISVTNVISWSFFFLDLDSLLHANLVFGLSISCVNSKVK